MSGTDMNDPYVEKLTYRVIIPEYTDYNNAPPTSGETGDFNWLLNKDQLVIQMKTHCATENEAREIVDEYLKAWEVMAGLLHQPDSLAFRFSSALILDEHQGMKIAQTRLSKSGYQKRSCFQMRLRLMCPMLNSLSLTRSSRPHRKSR
jgi:hypothetical protein